MDPEDIQIEELKQKITKFNQLMTEISHDFSTLILLGKEDRFHEIVMEMVKSLDIAQKTVKKAYYLFDKRKNDKEISSLTSENGVEKLDDLKIKLQEYTMFMEGLSEELKSKFFEGKHTEFHDAVEDMMDSLDKTRETAKKAYFLTFGKGKDQKGFRGSGGGP